MSEKNIVFKFGGVTVGKEVEMWENFPIILKHINSYRKTHNIVIVVSAPAGKTRELIKTANSLKLTGTNYDKVIGLGENITVNLFSAFLSQNKIQNESFIYPNYPIITDANYGDADILKIKINTILSSFANNKIVIVPGFVGQTENRNHTTIGLNGSDTTAIYLAKKLNAECVFFKDVDGIYPANPKKNSGLKPFKEVHYSDVLKQAEKTEQQILHPKGIKYAWENEIILWVSPIKGQGAGTCVSLKPQKRGVKNINGVYTIEKEL